MTAAVVSLAGATVVLAVVVCVLVIAHQRERTQWAAERGRLVNRAIARHSGEVLALDRQDARARDDNGDSNSDSEDRPRQLIEGLS